MTDETATFDPGTARNTTTDGDSSSAQGGWDDRAHRLLDDFERGWLRGERPVPRPSWSPWAASRRG